MTGDPALAVASHREGSTLDITVAPRSSADALERGPDGALRVRVTAPPVGGKANAAVLRLLAAAIGIPPSRVTILSGGSGRRKRVLVREVAPDLLGQRLEAALARAR